MRDANVKLPKYVFQRPNGSYRYKRNVPKRLRKYIKHATLYRQLGNTYDEAIARLPYVHHEIENLFAFERLLSPNERARALAVANFGEKTVRSSELTDFYDHHGQGNFDEFYELAEELEGTVPHEVLVSLSNGNFQPPPMTLERTFQLYRQHKGQGITEPKDLREFQGRLNRLEQNITACLGKHFFTDTPIKEIRRQNANALRDHLLQKMAPNSVVRVLNILKAAINYVIQEEEVDARNPFANLKVQGAGASKTDRLPLTDNDMQLASPAFEGNEDAEILFSMLADTGARLAEVLGLEARDIDLDQRTMTIRPNALRRLKTKGSERTVPLSQRVAERLRGRLEGLLDTHPIFPNYARPRGADSASAMLMKRLRSVIKDPKKVMHSLRHRMKDQLRDTGCPEDLSRAILGHSDNSVAANYGSGYAMNKMREAMEKVWSK